MRRELLGVTVVILLALGAITGACGGSSDSLSLDDYFAEVETLDAAADAQVEALYDDFPSEANDNFTDENLPYFKELTAGFPVVVGDLVDGLNDLDPPSEVEDAHNELVAAGEALRMEFQTAADAVGEIDTMADFIVLNGQMESTLQPFVSRFDSACVAVVDVAEANDIATTVSCEDEG